MLSGLTLGITLSVVSTRILVENSSVTATERNVKIVSKDKPSPNPCQENCHNNWIHCLQSCSYPQCEDECFITFDRCIESCDAVGTTTTIKTTTTTTTKLTSTPTTIQPTDIPQYTTTLSSETCENNCYEKWLECANNCSIGDTSCPSMCGRLHYECISACIETTDSSTTTTTITTEIIATTTLGATTTTLWSETCQSDCYDEWIHCVDACLESDEGLSQCESSCFTNYVECLTSCDD